MALGEVGVSLPWWCHPLVLLAPGYWRLFLNLVLLFQNWKSKIREVSIHLLKVSTSTEHKKQKKGHRFDKRLETLWILDFQFWNNNTKFRKSLVWFFTEQTLYLQFTNFGRKKDISLLPNVQKFHCYMCRHIQLRFF